jgi:hypothetical protein
MHLADRRYRRGNPPGKQDRRESLGDAINWEALLGYGAEGDLYMVAEDFDWASPLDATTFNSYLQDEWHGRCKGEVHFYQRLKAFLDHHFPDIKLTSEKDALIEELASTRDFRQTHQVIARLDRAGAYDSAQLNAIVSAVVSNDQVYRILDDPDVEKFLVDNLENRGDEVDPKLLQYLVHLANTYGKDEDLNLLLSLELAFSHQREI